MNRSLIFFGNERLATGVVTSAPALSGLIADGWAIKAIVVSNAEAHGRRKRPLEVARTASKYEIPLMSPVDATPDKLKALGAEAGVLAAYGKIVPEQIINVFPRGIINIHPSLLPLYRGSTPIEQAILDGAPQTGVSLMALVPKMDAGPVYASEKISLNGQETKQELADRLDSLGSRIMLANLESILDGTLKPTPQTDSRATYTKQLSKADGLLDLSKPAEILEREVRAFAGWPRSRVEVFGHSVIITQARVVSGPDNNHLVLRCNPGYLAVQELIAPSGRQMSGADFMRGYRR